MAYHQELVEAACYHVDEQTKQIRAFDLRETTAELPSRSIQLFQLVADHAQSIGKLLRYIYTDDSRVRVTPENEVQIATGGGDVAIILAVGHPRCRLKCILPSEKQNEVQHFDTSADMVAWLKIHVT